MFRKSRKQLTIRFLQRTLLFLVSFSAGLFLFFLFGNGQGFLDVTQRMILVVLASSAAFATLLSLFMLILEIVFLALRRKKFYFATIAISLVCMALSSSFAIVARAILLLSAGLAPR